MPPERATRPAARRSTPPAAREMTIRVHYPLESGRIVLRADPDWTADVEAESVDAAGTGFDFRLPLDGAFRYFKPVLIGPDGEHWAQGENALALANGHSHLEVYPHFFADSTCSVCNHQVVGSARDKDREHGVRVFYPPGYGENVLERYPVVYMQDGQNLFFPDEAFGGHHWMVEETLRVLSSMNLVRKAIVVGVYPNDRMRDYTLDGYEAYGRYLVDDLKPWLDAHYRTLDGPENTGVMGSSLGGVVSFYLAWQWPRIFGLAACLSSTFGYRDDLMERVAAERRRDLKIYLDSGWPRDNYEVTRRMKNLLVERGYRLGSDLQYLAFPRATHDERSWAMRAHVPFQHFFAE